MLGVWSEPSPSHSVTLVTRGSVRVQPEAIEAAAVVGASDVDAELLALVLAARALVNVWRQRQPTTHIVVDAVVAFPICCCSISCMLL